MIPRYGCSAALLWLALMVLSSPSLAQIEDNVLGLSDENLEGYLSPLNTGLSGTMNSAIFRTGFVPQQRFDLSVGLAVMAVGFGSEDQTYLPTDPDGFTSLEPTKVPTIIGDPAGMIVEGESGLSQIYAGGFDLDGFEIAAPQISLGTVMGTRATLRYMAADLGDAELGDFSYYGVGAQHSISQWFDDFPVDLAAGFFFQGLTIGDGVVDASTLHLNLTASRQYGIIQPYVGVGYDSSELSVDAEDEDNPEESISATLEKQNNFHLTLGAMARLSFVGLFFEFNAAAGTGFALGLDFGTIGGANYAVDDTM
ncbi:MAG: hypothetical protein KAY32_04650 [Candidatus Eisenbacteria sp.]|nr:hypothetical protein [Candidatus Eisenbacteria bacterium]